MNATVEETRAGEAIEQLFRVPLYQGRQRVGFKQVWAVDATAAWAAVAEQLESSDVSCEPPAPAAGAEPVAPMPWAQTPAAPETDAEPPQPQPELTEEQQTTA